MQRPKFAWKNAETSDAGTTTKEQRVNNAEMRIFRDCGEQTRTIEREDLQDQSSIGWNQARESAAGDAKR